MTGDDEDDPPDLFSFKPKETGGVRHGDPDSSRHAAETIDITEQQAMVLEALRSLRAGSAVDVGKYHGLPRDFLGPRFDRMKELGWIKLLGTWLRPNERDRMVPLQVWALAEATVDLEALAIKPIRKKDPFGNLVKHLEKMLPRLTADQRETLMIMLEPK